VRRAPRPSRQHLAGQRSGASSTTRASRPWPCPMPVSASASRTSTPSNVSCAALSESTRSGARSRPLRLGRHHEQREPSRSPSCPAVRAAATYASARWPPQTCVAWPVSRNPPAACVARNGTRVRSNRPRRAACASARTLVPAIAGPSHSALCCALPPPARSPARRARSRGSAARDEPFAHRLGHQTSSARPMPSPPSCSANGIAVHPSSAILASRSRP